MNISKDKYKCLDVLLDGKAVKVAADDQFRAWLYDTATPTGGNGITHFDYLNAMFSKMRGQIRSDVIMVSRPMQTLVAKNYQRMVDALCEDWIDDRTGALLQPDGDMFVFHVERAQDEYTHLDSMTEEEQCNGIGILAHVDRRGFLRNAVIVSSRVLRGDEREQIGISDSEGRNRLIMYDTAYQGDAGLQRVIQEFSPMLTTLAFLQYADTEVVHIENGQKKAVTTSNETVQNTTGMPIKYYDSKWVREIIRTSGFLVRGHFRKIRDKQGRMRLIYIHEFQKHGYHRKAAKDIA